MTSCRMRRLGEAALGLALLLGIFQSGCSVTFDVKDESGKSCILADLSIDFVVDYKIGDKQGISKFVLPEKAETAKTSSCGTKSGTVPLLVIGFGTNNTLGINFTKSDKDYRVDTLLFTYNLSDAVYFPNSTENGTRQEASSKAEISALTNRYYKCFNPHLITMGNVNMTFHNVKLEAYLNGNNYSTNATSCKEDVSPTSAPPIPPTTAPVKPKIPDVGNYSVDGTSGVCILAKMGLQLNITYKTQSDKNASYEFNIEPTQIKASGTCSKTYSTLLLSSEKVSLLFNFTLNLNESKFYLGEVAVNTTIVDAKDPKFSSSNGSLSFLKTTTRKSYKCNSKETLQVTDSFSIDFYNLQIQAFDIDNGKFGPAVECAADQNGMLVPIIVGAALAGLVLIVLIAYLIGRKRSHAGYQTI
ncbi:lysosome-associated membrane glycoprotein 1 [Leptodactylus fuscus]|uniref:lysosome-associated membrane glycoprotein 1 n=1 Tax=Leptodactylus fuscus TaxID=238119 RepID=UPI003F4ED021